MGQIDNILKEARWINKVSSAEYLKLYGNRSERIKKHVAILEDGIKNKMIWNVDFKDAKDALSRIQDESVDWLLNWRDKNIGQRPEIPPYPQNIGYNSPEAIEHYKKHMPQEHQDWQLIYNDGTFGTPREYAIKKKKLTKLKNKIQTSSVKRMIDDYLRHYESLEHLHNLLEEAKKYIKKGRKPNPNAPVKEIYVPPPSSHKDLAMVEKTLRDLTKKMRKDLVKNYENYVMNGANDFFKKREKDQSLMYYVFRGKGQYLSNIYDILKRIIEEKRGEKPKLSSDHKSKVKKFAKASAEGVIMRFIEKNKEKLTSIIGKKGALKQSKAGRIYTSQGFVTGEILFEFMDGSKFQARNQVVIVWNYRGNPFFRFPTTFHDIEMADGKKFKMKPEKWMNEEFTKVETK